MSLSIAQFFYKKKHFYKQTTNSLFVILFLHLRIIQHHILALFVVSLHTSDATLIGISTIKGGSNVVMVRPRSIPSSLRILTQTKKAPTKRKKGTHEGMIKRKRKSV